MTELANVLTELLHWEYLQEMLIFLTLIWPILMLLKTLELWRKKQDG
jgi:hypothetical protein